MRVSVAMAVYNSERYLPEQLASLARQTLMPHELVVHDDGSTDRTFQLLERFAGDAPFPVRVERSDETCGHVQAFLGAAARCEGDAVAFCDQDDVWLDHKLEVCAHELETTGAALVLHGARVVDHDLRDLGRNWPDFTVTQTVPPLGLTGLDTVAPGMAMVLRRDVLEVGRGCPRPVSRYDPDAEMLHDEWALFLAGAIGSVRQVADPLVLYRQHGANQSGGWFASRRRNTLEPALEHYREAARHTRDCARFLSAAAREHPSFATRLEAAANHYRRTAESWEGRVALYDAATRRARIALLRRLVSARAYRPRTSGGFGRVAFAKDIVGGVALRVGAQ